MGHESLNQKPVALTIAGSDPSGGAGIQADLKTFHQQGVYGMSVLTLLTVQNTQGVKSVTLLEPELVIEQLQSVLEDIPCQAAKTGALGNSHIIQAIAKTAKEFSFPLVVDPVMVAKNGASLLEEEVESIFIQELLPQAALVTPNLYEAERLTGIKIESVDQMEPVAKELAERGRVNVLLKGGHLKEEAVDLLYLEGKIHYIQAERIETPHTHGTGCTYSAVITAELAKGKPLLEAVTLAKKFITEAIQTNPGLGHGHGPVNHHIP